MKVARDLFLMPIAWGGALRFHELSYAKNPALTPEEVEDYIAFVKESAGVPVSEWQFRECPDSDMAPVIAGHPALLKGIIRIGDSRIWLPIFPEPSSIGGLQ